jgi:hypothetical protein
MNSTLLLAAAIFPLTSLFAFGGSKGEIMVYDDDGVRVVETIQIDGGSGYGRSQQG